MAAAATRPLLLSGALKGVATGGRVTSHRDHLVPQILTFQGQKAFGVSRGRGIPSVRQGRQPAIGHISCGFDAPRTDEAEGKNRKEVEEEDYAAVLLKMGAVEDPLKWLTVGLGLAALSWPEPAFAATSPGDLDTQVLQDLIASIKWGVAFSIIGPILTVGVQFSTGTNTVGLLQERGERKFQERILEVLNQMSRRDEGQVELATVMARALSQDVIKDRLKSFALELMKDEGVSAVSQKNMDEWLKPRIDSIDKEFADIKAELSEVKSELGSLASQVTIAVDLLKSMSGRHDDDMKVQ
eukprot:TRINITY_DN14250_c0_g1_i1.p1 TRINITY_DN14250_c0_g1~~TRINITY_DN14250_c0_g1_i1.p1  ORF type:complete len:298 (-),score=49.73 TRINITY_DN14250_c0_g1_i1:298-1191(-)